MDLQFIGKKIPASHIPAHTINPLPPAFSFLDNILI